MRNLEYYTGRKFLLTATSLAFTFALALNDKLTTEWAMALGVVLAFYNGANVAQKYVDMRRSNAELRRLENDDYGYDGYDDGPSWHRGRRY